MASKEFRTKIAAQIRQRLLPAAPLRSISGRNTPMKKHHGEADIELNKYIRSSTNLLKGLNDTAFNKTRRFYRTPSPHPPSHLRISPNLTPRKPLEAQSLPREVGESNAGKSRWLQSPWLAEKSYKVATVHERTARSSTPLERLKNLDGMISEIIVSSVKEKRRVSVSTVDSRLKYKKMKLRLDLTADQDLMQFKGPRGFKDFILAKSIQRLNLQDTLEEAQGFSHSRVKGQFQSERKQIVRSRGRQCIEDCDYELSSLDNHLARIASALK
jgi:hypothetical protein